MSAELTTWHARPPVRVGVVEDEPDLRRSIVRALERDPGGAGGAVGGGAGGRGPPARRRPRGERPRRRAQVAAPARRPRGGRPARPRLSEGPRHLRRRRRPTAPLA